MLESLPNGRTLNFNEPIAQLETIKQTLLGQIIQEEERLKSEEANQPPQSVTPYKIHCRNGCGAQFLSPSHYRRQMMDANSTWRCPRCNLTHCGWDDAWFEACEELGQVKAEEVFNRGGDVELEKALNEYRKLHQNLEDQYEYNEEEDHHEV